MPSHQSAASPMLPAFLSPVSLPLNDATARRQHFRSSLRPSAPVCSSARLADAARSERGGDTFAADANAPSPQITAPSPSLKQKHAHQQQHHHHQNSASRRQAATNQPFHISNHVVQQREAPSASLAPQQLPNRAARFAFSLAAAALAPAAAVFLPIHPAAAARESKSVITMTDQVPNFTLPSQERSVGGASDGAGRFAPALRVLNFACKRVLPPVAVLAVAAWAVRAAVRRAQEKQLRDFQTQLTSFSSMLDLDKDGNNATAQSAGGSGSGEVPVAERATRAREMLDGSRSRFRFRGDAKPEEDETELASKVQLDLFSTGAKEDGGAIAGDGGDAAAAAGTGSSATATSAQAVEATVVSADASSTSSSSSSSSTTPSTQVTPTEIADLPSATPAEVATPRNPLEQAVADALADARAGRAGGAAARVAAAQAAAGVSPGEGMAAVTAYLSRAVSAAIDGAAGELSATDETKVLTALQDLGSWMGAARAIAPDARLAYGGAHAGDETMVEEIYRRYALFCLSGAPAATATANASAATTTDASAAAAAAAAAGVGDDMNPVATQGLADMQGILGLGDARAEMINTEIAKGMFQVAVSAAMADGSLSDEDKQALENVKESFGSYLDGSSADSIVSEVAVMRAMYSLQQLLQDQGVSADDVRELRKMCKELGVDIDEMLQNADALGDALGAEAKQFVESLRGLLSSAADDKA